ncbi:MAG: serine/threonine protein kinase [Myxococcales bacterium]|nr:serine/threonine protein kinase [Myxococcales bacterium]
MGNARPQVRIGTVLGGVYQLRALVGEGGMGAVFEARHLQSGHRAAIKLLRDDLARDPRAVERFHRECRAASTVRHRNVIEVLQAGQTDDGVPFYAMAFLDGETLARRLETRGRLSEEEAVTVLAPVLGALAHAHRLGVIHRDVKPENIFLARSTSGQDRPVLMDFGVAAFLHEADLDAPGAVVIGTPAYMAPEQAAGTSRGHAGCDIYAVGVSLYELLTGLSPYQRENDEATLSAILNEGVRSPSRIVPAISPAMEAVILCAMARDPQHRFPSAEAAAAALHDALQEPAGSAVLQQYPLARTVIASRASQTGNSRRKRGSEFADNRARTVMIVLDKDGGAQVAEPSQLAAAAPPPVDDEKRQKMLALVASVAIFLVGLGVLLFALVSRGFLRR